MPQAEARNCQNCKSAFAIEPADFDFYRKMQVPPPTFCPECRFIRRLTFRNERTLYKRPCDLCKAEKIMMYPAGASFPVYCRQCWWSDQWDVGDYSLEIDFSRPFLAQFQELFNKVPRAGIVWQGNMVDSDYTNRVGDLRGSYLIFGSNRSEYCHYGVWMNECKECMDSYDIQKCEQCYECTDCSRCYRVKYSQESHDCTDSAFLYDCRNCQDCFGCVNLRNKRYCIWNEQYSKEDYQAKIASLQLGNALFLEGIRAKFESLKRRAVGPSIVGHHNMNASGNWIEGSKNTLRSFSCTNVEEAKYCFSIFDSKDVMDYTCWGWSSERVYETVNCGRQCANLKFSNECWDQVVNAEYVMNCHNSHDLFGCIGIRNGEYYILNKKYREEEYKELVARIRQAMTDHPYIDSIGRQYGYGEFFPTTLSPHAYNETVAQELFPITKAAAQAAGFAWRDEEERAYQATLQPTNIPDTIAETKDDILNQIVACAHAGTCNQRCTTAFRIIPEELQFYRNFSIPLPKLCPNCRHFERLVRRNPLRLWSRKCQCAGSASETDSYKNTASAHPSHGASDHCPNKFETSYAPERPETVYCEQCYQAEVA